jgi:hypothetical protein
VALGVSRLAEAESSRQNRQSCCASGQRCYCWCLLCAAAQLAKTALMDAQRCFFVQACTQSRLAVL